MHARKVRKDEYNAWRDRRGEGKTVATAGSRPHLQPLILRPDLAHDVLLQRIEAGDLGLYVVHDGLQRGPVARLRLLVQVVQVHVVRDGHLRMRSHGHHC